VPEVRCCGWQIQTVSTGYQMSCRVEDKNNYLFVKISLSIFLHLPLRLRKTILKMAG
jgi:hypothetical protein